jgi:SAM-dependent methyltransferase
MPRVCSGLRKASRESVESPRSLNPFDCDEISCRSRCTGLGTRRLAWRFSNCRPDGSLAVMLPVPPENLRVWVGPFADADLFRESGREMVRSIIALCGLKPEARVLEIGCGCGRVAAALTPHLSGEGRYDGFDVAAPLIDWCRQELESRLPRFHFRLINEVFAGGHNPTGHKNAADFNFPFADDTFDLAILCSVLTHMLPDGIGVIFERRRAFSHPAVRPSSACSYSTRRPKSPCAMGRPFSNSDTRSVPA